VRVCVRRVVCVCDSMFAIYVCVCVYPCVTKIRNDLERAKKCVCVCGLLHAFVCVCKSMCGQFKNDLEQAEKCACVVCVCVCAACCACVCDLICATCVCVCVCVCLCLCVSICGQFTKDME